MSDIDNVHKNHRRRLRDRYEREGADSLEPHELLELFLFDAIPRVNTNPIAHRLLARFGSLDGVFRATFAELLEVKGIGERAAAYIVEAAENERRRVEATLREKPLASFERASNYLIWCFHGKEKVSDSVTAIMMDETLHVIDTRNYKTVDVTAIVSDCADIGAVKLIIGCGANCVPCRDVDADEFLRQGITLCDVISVDGYDAESIMRR